MNSSGWEGWDEWQATQLWRGRSQRCDDTLPWLNDLLDGVKFLIPDPPTQASSGCAPLTAHTVWPRAELLGA